MTENGGVDWDLLRTTVIEATEFLDCVVTANKYVASVPQLKEAAEKCRRIGLGIMGFGDMLYHLRIRYGSRRAQVFASQLMEFIRYHAMLTSIRLAKDIGAFPGIAGSIYDPANITWTPPAPIDPVIAQGRPECRWADVLEGIAQHGIRNACITTIAPTGTIATVAGCEGYGCEPVFALAYYRNVEQNGTTHRLTYVSPLFEDALTRSGISEERKKLIISKVLETGNCQDILEVPEDIRRVFAVSADITGEEHVSMQAAFQIMIDNSLSKTCNLPEDATEEDVAKCYIMAWKKGCKGLTVYVTGSRNRVVLETKAEVDRKKALAATTTATTATSPALPMVAPRPHRVNGTTYAEITPLGKLCATINSRNGAPFEMFIQLGKAGSSVHSCTEAIARLVSLILRIRSDIPTITRMGLIGEQLVGIGGGRASGRGQAKSMPDAIARIMYEYLDPDQDSDVGHSSPSPSPLRKRIGDICPECGDATLIYDEGCCTCIACGHSECG